MTHILFENNDYELLDDETILDCLLRHNVAYPHSCKNGNCQSCLCQSSKDFVDPAWQKGLKPTLIEQGYFLVCQAKSKNDIHIFKPNTEKLFISSHIRDIFYFNHDVLCLRLSIENKCEWKGGQYLNLCNPNQMIRSYSIANLPEIDGYIELHIKVISNGIMSNWIANEAKIGDSVLIRGPIGHCFYYNPNKESYPIVLAGTGTGLAPLLGVLKEALYAKHPGELILIHGGVKSDDLYLDSTLTALAEKHHEFTYKKSILHQKEEYEPIDKILLATLKNIKSPTLYVCGPPDTTKMLKTKAFLSGVASKQIYSDSFNFS